MDICKHTTTRWQQLRPAGSRRATCLAQPVYHEPQHVAIRQRLCPCRVFYGLCQLLYICWAQAHRDCIGTFGTGERRTAGGLDADGTRSVARFLCGEHCVSVDSGFCAAQFPSITFVAASSRMQLKIQILRSVVVCVCVSACSVSVGKRGPHDLSRHDQ